MLNARGNPQEISVKRSCSHVRLNNDFPKETPSLALQYIRKSENEELVILGQSPAFAFSNNNPQASECSLHAFLGC
jgi:hypothetical protein